jgi:hypothetical protein
MLSANPDTAEELAEVLYDIGKDEYEKKRFENAIRWLERALDILGDQNGAMSKSESVLDLKCSTISMLIKTLMDLHTPGTIQKAQSIMALMETEFGDRMLVLFLKLELLAAEKTPEPGLYRSILLRLFRSTQLTKSNFKTLMHHVHKLRHLDPKEACQALDDFLTIRLFEQENEEFTERALVMRIWITTSLPDCSRVIESIKEFLDLISRYLRGPVSTTATHASQTLIWKLVESQMNQKCHEEAELLCRLALSPVFNNTGDGNKAKISRKIMICALASNDFAAAREAFFGMPEAAQENPHSRFLLYKVALRSQDFDLGEPSSLEQKIA